MGVSVTVQGIHAFTASSFAYFYALRYSDNNEMKQNEIPKKKN